MLIGGFIGLTFVLSTGLNSMLDELIYWPQNGLSSVLNRGLSGALLNIQRGGLALGLTYGLSAALIYWLPLGLLQGVSSQTLDEQRLVVPNEGIRRSARNSLLIGLIIGLMSGLICLLNFILKGGLGYGLTAALGSAPAWELSDKLRFGLREGLYGLYIGLSDGLSVGGLQAELFAVVVGGLLAGLLTGGLACLRHGILRWLLWRAGSIPWSYPRFLDNAAERLLLRKVEGGYIFTHRLLLEYFATVETTPPCTPII